MRWLFCILAVALCISCQSNKKKTAQETQQQYDYRAALQNYQIGINYLNNGDVHNAILHLQTAVNGDGNNFRYRHGLGLAYSMNGQMEEAISELKAAIGINPTASESHNLLGSVYTELGRYDEAVASLKKVITDSSYPQPQFPYFNLGLCMKAQNRLDEAIAAFTRATQLDPKFYRGYIALADIYKEQGDFNKALLYFQQAEPGFSNDVNVLFQIGYSFFKLNQYEKAKAYLAQVSILFPPPEIDKPTQEMLRYIEKVQREARN